MVLWPQCHHLQTGIGWTVTVCGRVLPRPDQLHCHQDHYCGHLVAPQIYQNYDVRRPEIGPICLIGEILR